MNIREKIEKIYGIIRVLTFLKILNAFQIFISFYKSKKSRKAAIKGLPISISVEPTTACNLRCPQCISGLRNFTRPTGMMEIALFQKIVDELSPTLLYLNLYFQGEPYLNTDFLEMVKYASQRKIYTSTSTNAHYFTPENAIKTVRSGLDRLIISIDGVRQESYEKYRIGGEIEKVWQGINALQSAKKQLNSSSPHIILQFIVFKHNEHEVDDIIQKSKEFGLDLQIKTAQIYDQEGMENLNPAKKHYSRYSQEQKTENECWKMWHSAVITWDGKVVPCCFDKDANFEFGNINIQPFYEIWNNNSYSDFRNKLFSNRQEISMCNNCSEGSKIYI
jgi:radical SAM protein with 4Fe4S-binding SPASM domain